MRNLLDGPIGTREQLLGPPHLYPGGVGADSLSRGIAEHPHQMPAADSADLRQFVQVRCWQIRLQTILDGTQLPRRHDAAGRRFIIPGTAHMPLQFDKG